MANKLGILNKLIEEFSGLNRIGRKAAGEAIGAGQVLPNYPYANTMLQPYQTSGADIANYLQDIPRAVDVAGTESQINSAGKVGSSFSGFGGEKLRGGDLLSTFESTGYTPSHLNAPRQAAWSEAEGKTVLVDVGDPTGFQAVETVGQTRLPRPQQIQAGAEFMDTLRQGWGSALQAVSAKRNAELGVIDPLRMFVQMGDKSGDFALPTGRMIGEAFRVAPISSANVSRIDEAIRNISMQQKVPRLDSNGNVVLNKKGNIVTDSITIRPFTDFRSVSDPDYLGAYIEALPSGSQRAAFVKGLDKQDFLKMGAPDIGHLRLAASNPDLIGRDWLSMGYRAHTPDTNAGMLQMPSDINASYDTMTQKVGDAMSFDQGGRGAPAALVMRDLAYEMRQKGTGGNLLPTSAFYKVLESSPRRAQQLMDAQQVEILSTFNEIERRNGRGAALQYADELLRGPKITKQMIDAARRNNTSAWGVLPATAAMGGLVNSVANQGEQY